MRIPLLLSLALAASCVSPRYALETEYGVVRGDDEARVAIVSGELGMATAVRERLSSTREGPVEVLLLRSERVDTGAFAGLLSDGRIVLGEDAFVPLRAEFGVPMRIDLTRYGDPRYYVAHELAHWLLRESPYEGVPTFVEEGLADTVALELLGHLEARHAELVDAEPRPLPRSAILASREEYLHDDSSMQASLLGTEVVRRLGFDEIRRLRARDADPFEYVNAAKVKSGPWPWVDAE